MRLSSKRVSQTALESLKAYVIHGSVRAAADARCLSEDTVEDHLRRLREQFRVRSSMQLLVRTIKDGLIPLDDLAPR